jgi:hypothetical protein
MLKRLLQYAESYLSKGFSVIPVKAKQKSPAVRWKEFQFRNPTHKELMTWFGHKSRYGIAIVTGKISGICVMDFDSLEAYQEAERKGLPETPIVKTSKGFHLYFRYADGMRNFQMNNGLLRIDIRGDGGYVVAPPSVHPSGHRYEWVEGKSLDDLPLAELPEWIMRELRTSAYPSPHKNKQGHELMQKRSINELLHGVDKGERNHSMTRIAGWLISQGFSYGYCLRFLRRINQRNRPPLPSYEVKRILQSIMRTQENRIKSLVEQKLRESQSVWEKARPIFFDISLHKK